MDVAAGLLAAYRQLMQPLVRILIRNGVSYGEFNELLRSVFVEVAERDFGIPGRKPSQSRIAILTGLTRKEVARQKAILEGGEMPDEAGNLNRVTRVLLGWHTDPDYTGPYGVPIEVPFDANEGPSFVELVRRHSGDMAPRAMLDELLRVGAIEKLSTGWFKVLTRAYVPESLHPDALERLGSVVRNFVNTVEFNMEKTAPGAGRFERVVVADDGLRADLLPAFDKLLRIKGQQLLVELDNWLSAQEVTPTAQHPVVSRIKTGVGIYHYIEADEEGGADEQKGTTS
jgi:Family of unknown function (DUF6502)